MMATGGPESPAFTERFMEAICDPDNIEDALKAVVRNKGAPGVDGMTVKQLPDALKARWPQIEVQLLAGRYRPQPVRRVKIPKPDGGERHLGIPTVIDRVIQQAILQRLQPLWDPTFSEHAYGFRPGRSAHQAVAQAQAHVIEGHRFVVDIDLAKFFDRVNHDRLMATVAARVADRRLLRLIRSFLTAGVLDNGLFEASEEGTPQGGPLSPLLSNLVLDELDRELERRGHRFVRYADDCNIYVRSEKAGRRVMQSVTRFIERRLKLQVNAAKSAVDRPWRRSFLRVCPETLCGIAEFSQHEADGGEAEEGERLAVEAFPILGQSATAAEPGETAFDDPALGQDGEALGLIRPLDDLDRHARQNTCDGALES